jgi:uncharacterized protein YqgC (DUF456 family)
MVADIIVTVVAGVLLALVTLIAWGWVLGSAASWTAAGIGAVLVCVGWSASALLTGRKLKREKIPRRSILVAVLAGIVGMFVIPLFGLLIGFAAGLFVSEYVRVGDSRTALRSSLEALKATGLGMLVEFAMVALAGSVWTIGVIVHFAT